MSVPADGAAPVRDDEAFGAGRRTRLTLLLVGMVAIGAMAATGAALTPSLLAHQPLLLIALNPSIPHLITLAPSTEWPAFVAVAVARLLLSDPLYYALGRWFGPDAVTWASRKSGPMSSVALSLERSFARWGSLMVFMLPYGMFCILAGAAGMSRRRFWTLNLLGTITLVSLLRLFGRSIAAPIGQLTSWVDSNSGWLTYAVIALIVLGLVGRRLTQKPDPRGINLELRRGEAKAAPDDE